MKSHLPHFMAITVILTLVFPSCRKEIVWNWKQGTPMPKEKMKIAFIHPNDIDSDSLYDHAHYMGTLQMQKNIGLEDSQIIRKVNVFEADPAMVEGAMRDSIAEGANFIIAMSWGYMDTCEKLAPEFPSVLFAHINGYKYNERNFTSCSVRLYQVRYLSGIVAGMKTKTGKIGYVAAMGSDNSEVTAGINAFAIGVEEVNPEARILVRVTYSWYDPMGETDAANALIAYGCDVLAAHCNTPAPQIAAQRAGVWAIGFNSDMSANAPDAVITSVFPRWDVLYTRLAGNIINGSFSPAIRFFGLADGMVGMTPINETLAAPGTEAAVQAARQRIMDGFNVFDGLLETNTGKIIGEEGKTLSGDVIRNYIDWYYRNVVVIR